MKKIILITQIIMLFTLVFANSSDFQIQSIGSLVSDKDELIITSQDSCDYHFRAKENSFLIKVNCSNHTFYNCIDLIPRKATVNELCLIESLRHDSQVVVYQLDDLHDVFIFPINQIKTE